MIDTLAAALTAASLVAAVAVLVSVLAGRYRWRHAVPVLVGGEILLSLQAAGAVVRVLQGHRPGEPVVFTAYLATSVLLLPVVAVQARGRDDRWSGVLVAAGLIVLAVVDVRAAATWRP